MKTIPLLRSGGATALTVLEIVVLGFLAAGPPAGAEDCIAFNPATASVQQISGHWKVVDGSMWLMDFGNNQANAQKALSIIQHYQMNQQCFVGRPNAPMMYFKTATGFPQGSFPGQDAISFDPSSVTVQNINGNWTVVDCDMALLAFSSQALAQQAVTIIQSDHFVTQCFVGRPNPPMMYFLANPAYTYSESLNVPLIGQETAEWCWAASGEMAMKYLGHDVSQCVEANNEFNCTNCCQIPLCPNPATSGKCVHGGSPQFNLYGFTYQQTTCNYPYPNAGTALTWDQLKDQIHCQHKPVVFAWNWEGGGGHVLVVVGLQEDSDGSQWVEIHDPLPVCGGTDRLISYDDYAGNADDIDGHHDHQCDFYDITYK